MAEVDLDGISHNVKSIENTYPTTGLMVVVSQWIRPWGSTCSQGRAHSGAQWLGVAIVMKASTSGRRASRPNSHSRGTPTWQAALVVEHDFRAAVCT